MVRLSWGVSLLCLALAACGPLENPGNVTAAEKAVRAQAADGNNMVSINAADAPPALPPPPKRGDQGWPPVAL